MHTERAQEIPAKGRVVGQVPRVEIALVRPEQRDQVEVFRKTLKVEPDPVRADLSRPFLGLTASFCGSIVLTLAWLALALTRSQHDILAFLLLAALAASFVGFFICLGVLAKRLHGNWVLWAVLSMVLAPPGIVVAYLFMWRKVRNATT